MSIQRLQSYYLLTEQRHAFAQVDGLGRDRSVMSGL